MTSDAFLTDDGRRAVSAQIEAEVLGDEASIILAVGVADHYERDGEQLSVSVDGTDVVIDAIPTVHAGRLHLLRNVGPGRLEIRYEASVVGLAPSLAATDHDWVQYLRPSRYCESDRLGPFARAEFAGLEGADLLAGISSWVGSNILYVPGSSRPIDGAVATVLAREGVCRDFAHVTAALLRANDVAARVVAVYAPGLDPMDFHAVAEACLDGVWYVVDPTCLAPRQSMVRIATGADAADIAFITNIGGAVDLSDLRVTAVASPSLPTDDVTMVTELR